MQIIYREFLKYKFLNSLFLGLSIGAVFTIYMPLDPSVFSIGGIALAIGMLFIAKLYAKILHIEYFYKISLFVELVLLCVICMFLVFSYSYTTALLIYVGYQLTFSFGAYLMRAETLFLKRNAVLSMADVVKQKGYLAGMALSYLFYIALEKLLHVNDKNAQVYTMHFLLLGVEIAIIFYLMRSFTGKR